MGLSIQDYLKKINSWLTYGDILSILVTSTGIALLLGYIWHIQIKNKTEVIYQENNAAETLGSEPLSMDGAPFGSKKGKTYTFTWCSGSGNIKASNKIYFVSSEEAEAKGRTLSKLCKK